MIAVTDWARRRPRPWWRAAAASSCRPL